MRGETETGRVFEPSIPLEYQGQIFDRRRVVIRLKQPTRDGDRQIAILTNLPVKDADAVAIANIYRQRWSIETLFQVQYLRQKRVGRVGFGIVRLLFTTTTILYIYTQLYTQPMPEILTLLQCLQPYMGSTSMRQLSRILQAMLATVGRVTMLGISRWAGKGGSYRTVQRFFQETLPWATLLVVFFRQHLWCPSEVYLLAGDEVVVTKAGKKTYGVERFFSSLYGKSLSGLSFFALSLISVKSRHSFPIRIEQRIVTEAEKKIAKSAKSKYKKSASSQTKNISKNQSTNDVESQKNNRVKNKGG